MLKLSCWQLCPKLKGSSSPSSDEERFTMSNKISWYNSLVTDQVTFLTRVTTALVLLVVGIPIAGALSEDSAHLGIFIGAVSFSILALVSLLGTIARLNALSQSIPDEVQDTEASKLFQRQPWSVFTGLIFAVIVAANVGFALILL